MFNSNIWPNCSFTRYKASKSEWPWLWPFKVTQGKMWWCHLTLHIHVSCIWPLMVVFRKSAIFFLWGNFLPSYGHLFGKNDLKMHSRSVVRGTFEPTGMPLLVQQQPTVLSSPSVSLLPLSHTSIPPNHNSSPIYPTPLTCLMIPQPPPYSIYWYSYWSSLPTLPLGHSLYTLTQICKYTVSALLYPPPPPLSPRISHTTSLLLIPMDPTCPNLPIPNLPMLSYSPQTPPSVYS